MIKCELLTFYIIKCGQLTFYTINVSFSFLFLINKIVKLFLIRTNIHFNDVTFQNSFATFLAFIKRLQMKTKNL